MNRKNKHFKIFECLWIFVVLIFITQRIDLAYASEETVLHEKRFMRVSGRFNVDNIIVDKVYTSTISFRSENTGSYAAELLDGQGMLLTSENFDYPVFEDSDCRVIDDELERFNIILPFDNRAQKLVIKKDGKIIWTRNRSLNSPVLTVESPVNGDVVNKKIEIKIKGYDRDGGNLHYMLESCNNSQDITEVKDRLVNIAYLCSYKEETTLRILCSDGFNTTESLVKVVVCNSLGISSKTSPSNVNLPIEVVFSRTKIDKDSINKESFLLSEEGTGKQIEGDISLNCLDYDCRLVFKPKNRLKLNTRYVARVAAGIKDVAGNVFRDKYEWSFIVGLWSLVKDISPTGRDESVNPDIRVTFNGDVDKNTINSKSFILKDEEGKVIEGMVTYDVTAKIAVFKPLQALAFNTKYKIILMTSAITGIDGSPIEILGKFERDFITGGGVRILDVVSDTAQDLNNDSLYDKLVLKMQIEILKPGRYNINASLKSERQRFVAWAIKTNQDFSQSGIYPVELEFKGADIARSAVDGPYEVYGLSIFDAGNGPQAPPSPELTYNFPDGKRTYPYKAKDFSF